MGNLGLSRVHLGEFKEAVRTRHNKKEAPTPTSKKYQKKKPLGTLVTQGGTSGAGNATILGKSTA